jgi:hypothetical protein
MKTFQEFCDGRGVGTGEYQDHEIIYDAGLIEGLECSRTTIAMLKANTITMLKAILDEIDYEAGRGNSAYRLCCQKIEELEKITLSS